MPDQVVSGHQILRDDVRDAVAVAHHVCLGGPVAVAGEALLVDGKPLEAVEVRGRDGGAVVVGAGRHVHGHGPAVVRPRVVVARADGAAGGDGGVRRGGRARIVADGNRRADGPRHGVPRVPLALDQVGPGLDPGLGAPLDAVAAARKERSVSLGEQGEGREG